MSPRLPPRPTLSQLGATQRRIIGEFGAPSARRFFTLRGRSVVERMACSGLLIVTRKKRGLWVRLTPHAQGLWAQLRESEPFS